MPPAASCGSVELGPGRVAQAAASASICPSVRRASTRSIASSSVTSDEVGRSAVRSQRRDQGSPVEEAIAALA